MECKHCGQFDAFRSVLVNGFVCNLCGGFNRTADLTAATTVTIDDIRKAFGIQKFNDDWEEARYLNNKGGDLNV